MQEAPPTAASTARDEAPERDPAPEFAPDRGRLLAGNTLWNLAGQGAPLVVAVFAIPALVSALGTDRFGLLALAWVFLGYFSLFDLGMSRAITQLFAEKLSARQYDAIPALLWTGLVLTLGLGLAGAALCWLLAPWVVLRLLTIPDPGAVSESLKAFYALAAAVPLVISTASLRGILEARQRFDVVNVLRLPMGVFTFAGPLLVLPFSRSLFDVVLVLVGARAVLWAAHVAACFRIVPELRAGVRFRRDLVGSLLRFGGWMTVSNLVSPLMVYMDRFLIGAVLTVSAVAYYATPWEMATKLLIVPSALSSVLFPAFGFLHRRDPERTARLYYTGVKLVVLALFPLTLAVTALARPGLAFWLGEAFAEASYRPLQILALGILLNGAATIPFALVQGLGRPDLTARLHLVELVLYAGVLWVLVRRYGITGAAMAWTLRVALDFGLLFALGRRLLRAPAREPRKVVAGLAAAVGLSGLALLPASVGLQAAVLAGGTAAYGVLAWRFWLNAQEKAFVLQHLDRRGR